jgi:hypothetical protein
MCQNQVRVTLFQHAGQQGKMIVLNEDDRGRVSGLLQHGVGEPFVDLAV